MPGLLYPAYQKLYSALCNLDRFDKEANLFDNISSLDSFLSEYRNITFVLKTQLSHVGALEVYDKNREKYLSDHWFVDKRNETSKEHPFQLVKEIRLTFYYPDRELFTVEKAFCVENDQSLEVILPQLKKAFSGINDAEVFFSASFSFHEKNSEIDLFDKLFSGISSMMQFMRAIEEDIGEHCELSAQLQTKIDNLSILNVPFDFLHINDYVYYPFNETFECGQRIAFCPHGMNCLQHQPLATLTHPHRWNYDGTAFNNFTFEHVNICKRQPELMPVILVVYGDGTFDMDVFHSTIKTTKYRKINETARLVCGTQDVKEVFYMSQYASLRLSKGESLPLTSKERQEAAEYDILVCASIDEHLNVKEYSFDQRKIADRDYVLSTMQHGMSHSLNVTGRNLRPIVQAFKNRSHQKTEGSC